MAGKAIAVVVAVRALTATGEVAIVQATAAEASRVSC